ncbi:MAG: ATP-grasp domain-containing protein [Verrucomicrobia bacterium]|nr:ATP-grasp domain-containing protein [Verrucomicrobiota bacterium]
MKLTILDFSVYGNRYDPESDALLEAATQRLGVTTTTTFVSREQAATVLPDSEWVWLRYDLRSSDDLELVVSLARRLEIEGRRVFPSAAAILATEDKWEGCLALRRGGVAVPETALAMEWARFPLPIIVKSRVGWGGIGTAVARDAAELERARALLDEEHICQPFIASTRTLVVALADGGEIACIEDLCGLSTDGRTRTVPMPPDAAALAARTLEATGLVAGTVDMIESPDGLRVLEVNSSPRITYPHLPELDLATPMMKAVLRQWMSR